MSSRQSLSSLFPHFLLLSLKRKSRGVKMECLEKGGHGLGGSVSQRLGSLALCNSGDNRAQWPLSRWLGDHLCDGVGYLLGIGRGRGSVLGVKRRRKRIHRSLVEGKTLGVCRDLAVGRNGGRIGPRLKNGGVDAKGRQFIVVRLGESLQGKLRRSIEAEIWHAQPSSNGPDLQQQTAALLTHLWQNRAVHAQDAEDIGLELLADLFQGEGLQWTTVGHPGVVDHHIKTTNRLDDLGDGPLHGGVIRDIDLNSVQGQRFSLRERAECFRRRGILACGRTHARENDVSLARQGFNSQTTKATGTASDENGLLHAHPSFLSRSRHTGPLLVTVEPGL